MNARLRARLAFWLLAPALLFVAVLMLFGESEGSPDVLLIERAHDMRSHAGNAARLMKALAHESRLLVLCVLSEGERSVGELNVEVGLSQSALSQHLAVLRRDGLVETRREAQTIYYRLADSAALDIIEEILLDRPVGSTAEAATSLRQRILDPGAPAPPPPGTRIVPDRKYEAGGVVGNGSEKGVCMMYVRKYLMNREVGFGRRFLQIFEEAAHPLFF